MGRAWDPLPTHFRAACASSGARPETAFHERSSLLMQSVENTTAWARDCQDSCAILTGETPETRGWPDYAVSPVDTPPRES